MANQASRPNPAFDAVRAIAARVGAHGVAVGHTGAAVALLLPAGSGTDAPAEALAAAGVRDVIAWDLG